jgi:hypothetical protein
VSSFHRGFVKCEGAWNGNIRAALKQCFAGNQYPRGLQTDQFWCSEFAAKLSNFLTASELYGTGRR